MFGIKRISHYITLSRLSINQNDLASFIQESIEPEFRLQNLHKILKYELVASKYKSFLYICFGITLCLSCTWVYPKRKTPKAKYLEARIPASPQPTRRLLQLSLFDPYLGKRAWVQRLSETASLVASSSILELHLQEYDSRSNNIVIRRINPISRWLLDPTYPSYSKTHKQWVLPKP